MTCAEKPKLETNVARLLDHCLAHFQWTWSIRL